MDTASTTSTYPSIMDIAHTVLSDPTSAKPADVTRLASFVIDHPEHIAFHRRAGGFFAPQGNGSLGRRLEGVANRPGTAPLPAPAAEVPQSPVVEPEADGHDAEQTVLA